MPGKGWGSGPWLPTGLLGLALILGTGTPATATSAAPASAGQKPVLSLSLDGQHWNAQLDEPLFGGDRRWVPGDTETVTVWVRNLATTAAALNVRLEPDSDSWRAADLDLSAQVDGQPVLTGSRTGGRRIDPITGPTRIDLTVTLPRRAGERAQRRHAPFSLRLELDETVAADVDPATTPAATPGAALLPGLSEPVGGHLPDTGTPPFGVPLALVGIAAAVRAAILARRSHQTRKAASCPHP